MRYYICREIKSGFDEAIENVSQELKNEGFGILSDIDVSQTLKEKLDVDYPRYRILGACNPEFAHRALKLDEKIGTMLPCNIVVCQKQNEYVEVSAVDPQASMLAVDNEDLRKLAGEVKKKLNKVITSL